MKLSIITVCFNAETCIEKTIISVLKQSIPVYEYIIIDGGSKDKTMSIVESYKKLFQEKGVKYNYRSESDKGISDAFNKGISLASGDLIGLINADDELLQSTCELLLKVDKQSNADILYGNCIWVDTIRNREYVSKPKGRLEQLLYKMTLIHPSTFVRKDAYNKCGFFDITYKYCMDKELLYRMYKGNMKFKYIDESLVKFKAGGVSDKHTLEVYKETSRMAIENGAPRIKVYMVQACRYAKTKLIQLIKYTTLYRVIKK